VIPRSLTGRVALGVLLVVAVVLAASGLTIVKLTERRDREDFDASLRRVASNLAPSVLGSLGIGPEQARRSPGGAPPGEGAPPPPGAAAPPPPVGAGATGQGPPRTPAEQRVGARRALFDAFSQPADDTSPSGAIRFLRARHPRSGRAITVGTVPTGFPAEPNRPGERTVDVDGARWRSVTRPVAGGVLVEVAAPETALEDRSSSQRTIVLVTTLAGLALAALATVLVSRVALRPLTELGRKAAGVNDSDDLALRVTEPGQPQEVAALAAELDGMLARLGRSAEEREAALQAARRFAADAGHELRTPLQSVRSNLEIARRDGVLPDQLRIALDTASSQSDRLNKLVDGLQGLARGEAGLQPTAGDVDLGDVADGAVFAARTRHPGLTVDLAAPESGPVVTGDSDGLWRVVENLVENAARYGRDGGRVRVTVASLGAGVAEIVVDDDGVGIPPAERERVLERFARGAGANGMGNGLGLAIVLAEAHRHGGDLTLSESDLGGLRARVTLG